MEMIMFNIGTVVPSIEFKWRPRTAIFRKFKKKNFNTELIHASLFIVEVNKYLCMSR